MTEFVLKEVVASKHRGKPIYFQTMTRIGPCNTDDLKAAEKFTSREDALRSPANRHMLSCYEPEEVHDQ